MKSIMQRIGDAGRCWLQRMAIRRQRPCPHRWKLLEAYEPRFPTEQLTWTPLGPMDITRANGKWRCCYCGCVKVGHESQWIPAHVA